MTEAADDKILIMWTVNDREVALNMVFMYGLNARLQGWWADVTILVWGPSANLLAQDTELQEHVRKMKEVGVRVVACKKCAENYGVVEALQNIGLEVFYSGKFLTEWLKAGHRLLTC